MKYCSALNGALNIERDRVHFCVAVKQNLPTVPWNPDEELPLKQIRVVREALIRGLNGDLDAPIPAYEQYGRSGRVTGHPCNGCRHIIEVDDDYVPCFLNTGKMSDYLHLQAFTYCNAKCTYCNLRRDEGLTPLSRGRDLDRAVYKAVAQLIEKDELSPGCRIIYSSGEPSISKAAMQSLADVVAQGYPVLVNTNAIVYAPEIEAALQSGNTHVQVSLESGDRQSFMAVKGVDMFAAVERNIARYAAAVRRDSTFWLKYIVFSQTNSRPNMDKFVDLCLRSKIKNVIVNANYNEGEDTVLNGANTSVSDDSSEAVDVESLNAFGYLAVRLELAGLCVHKEYSHLTTNEQRHAKRAYARAVLNALGFAEANEALINSVVAGLEMAALPPNDPCAKRHLSDLIQRESAATQGIALFGAGGHARWVASIMSEMGCPPVVALDNHPKPDSIFDFPVVAPRDISRFAVDKVIIASNAYHLQIFNTLRHQPEFQRFQIVDPYLLLDPV